MTTIRQLSFIFLGTSLLSCLLQTFRVNAFECGRVQLTRETILGGNETLKGEWPFIAALYQRSSNAYICGGTLISEKHILTAAHCIHKRYSSDDFEVRLGAHNLSTINEMGSIRKNVTKIFVHHDWKPENEDYDADVAVLVLDGNVTFSNFVQPICMPANDIEIDGETIDATGTVVGWGLSNTTYKHEETPKKVIIEAVNNSYCYREDPGIVAYSSQRTFCGKTEVGTPNKGDSGSGFLVVSMAAWMQYGIVSAIRTNAAGQATPNSFTVYTNVKPFKQWIVDVVKQSGSEVGEFTHKVNLSCRYAYFETFGYTCHIDDLTIRNAHVIIESVTGAHLFENKLDDVEVLDFNDGYMLSLPNGLGNHFKKVQHLKIGNSGASLRLKYITRSNLKNLENLIGIFVYDNYIETLEEDCLWDLPNLAIFHLINNKITSLADRFFERNNELVYIDLYGNRLETLPVRLFEHKFMLETLTLGRNSLSTIDETTFATNTKLKKVDLSSNKLEYLPGNLFRNNLLLQEIQLGENSIRFIGENIFQSNVHLTSVNLSHNYLESLPAKIFKNNSFLLYVMLDENLLRTIDENIFDQNLDLSTVTLSSNPLEIITPNLFKVNTKMNLLLLSNMSLTTIDETIFQRMPELWAIDISFNQIGSIPKTFFKNNTLLEGILLRNTSIKMLDEETFQANTKLTRLYLSSNDLEFLPKNLFKNNSLLEIVELTNNSLKAIDVETFKSIFNLQDVFLSGNKLESLPGNIFENNPLLRSVHLQDNALKEIDEQIFERNDKLIFVTFASNKLESLPRNLFKNNLSLEKANFGQNSLRIIDTNFSGLDNVEAISFRDNICIDTEYTSDSDENTIGITKNFTEFQNIVKSFCRSSTNSIE